MPDIQMETTDTDTGMRLTAPNFKLWMTPDGHLLLEASAGGRLEITPDGKMYVGTLEGDLVKFLKETVNMLLTHTHNSVVPVSAPTPGVSEAATILATMEM